jgi:glyoxylase-like metal-dependent hydrolase (beta-lactamase superfamily II)
VVAMNQSVLSRAGILILVTSLILITVEARQSSTASERSYQHARRVLDRGIQAFGGLEALRAVQTITLRESGKHRYIHQSPSVEPPFIVSPREETTIVDFGRKRLLIDTKIANPNYYVSNSATIINGGEGYTLDRWSKEAAPIVNASIANFRNHFFQRLPHYVLLEALDRASSLRWVGEDQYKGRKQNVITYAGADGRQTSLNFDAQTKLLTKIDFIYTDSVVGDGIFEIIYPGYRAIGGLNVPTGRITNISGEWQVQTDYAEVKVNSQPADYLFEVPGDFARVPAPTPQPFAASQIAKDIFLVQSVEGSGNAFFIAFDDYILAVDAPQSRLTGGGGERFIAKIKETVPGKPIKYLILTHHSYDHAAGARAFIAEGATIVTTPGNKQFVEKLSAAPFTIAPDALSRSPRKPVIETIENKKRVFRDQNHLVEVYDIGPNPSANEMVIVYLPKEKILYQTDLFNPGYVRTIIPAQVSTVDFAEKLKQLGLEVEKIAGGHGGITSPSDLQTALEKRRRMDMK